MARMPTSGRIEDAMRRNPITIDPSEPLLTAATTMLEAGVRHLPVVNERGELEGILSERDLRARLGRGVQEWFNSPEAALSDVVANVMTPDPLILRARHPLQSAIDVFEDERIGAIPVVDDEDRLVGMLSYIDVLDWIQREVARQPPVHRPDEATHTVPVGASDHTRELTGRDASPAQAELGSIEPPPEQAQELTPGPEPIEEEAGAGDLRPDHIEQPPHAY